MRIKLISPRMSLRPMDSEFKRVMAPSLSLLVVGALTPQGHEVEIADENTGRIRWDGTPDLVGINVNVDTARRAYEIAEGYRRRGITVVLGGIHASACPEEALRHADAVCIGDAEVLWPRIVADASTGRLQARYEHTSTADPALIPAPRWDLIDSRRYLYTNVVVTSRGCPHRCDFCYNSCAYTRGYRCRPIDQVIEEIRGLGTCQVLFVDDNFIGDIPRARLLIRAMEPLGLTWHAAVSANLVHHPDLLDQMCRTGCQSLFIGFESINSGSVEAVHKDQNQVALYERLIQEIHSRGMMVNASMVFGLDQDHPDVFDTTLDWLVRNRVETMTAHILTPYPETRLFARLQAEGRIVDHDWSHYNTSHVVFQPQYMTGQQLLDGYLKIYRRFYSLPCIFQRQPQHPRQRRAYWLFNLAYRKYGWFTAALARMGLMNLTGRMARRLSYGID